MDAKTAIYARKSTESEDRQVLSIDSQITELSRFAEGNNLRIAKIYRESKSAKAPGRPIFAEMMAELHKQKFDAILCWKLDRLARNPVDGGALIWALEERKLRNIHTPQRTFDNTGNDKFWVQLEFGMAKKYVDDLSDNTKRGLKAKLEQGWKPALPPLGYLNDKETKTIVRDPERFDLVRRMWDLMLSGKYSANKVLKTATEKWGLRSRVLKKVGGGPVAYSSIYSLFTNPFYYGAIVYSGEYYRGAHDAMVTKTEFDLVQDMLESRSKTRPKKKVFAFTGLIKCGECGASVTAEHKTNRYGYHYIYYHCTKRKRRVKCSQRYIEEKELEQQIISFLESITIRRSFLEWAKGVMEDLEAKEQAKTGSVKKTIKKRVAVVEKERSELVGMRLRDLLSDEEFRIKKKELENERISLEQSLANVDDTAGSVTAECERLFDLAYSAKKQFEKGSEKRKREILRAICSNLVLINKKLRIRAKKPFEIVQKYNSDSLGKTPKVRIGELGYGSHKNPPEKAGLCAQLRVVDNVRTFLRKEFRRKV